MGLWTGRLWLRLAVWRRVREWRLAGFIVECVTQLSIPGRPGARGVVSESVLELLLISPGGWPLRHILIGVMMKPRLLPDGDCPVFYIDPQGQRLAKLSPWISQGDGLGYGWSYGDLSGGGHSLGLMLWVDLGTYPFPASPEPQRLFWTLYGAEYGTGWWG